MSEITKIDYKKATNAQIDINIEELDLHNSKIETVLDEQKKNISNELKELFTILGSKDYKSFLDLQSNSLALRQSIQDSISFYMQKLSKTNANYKRMNGDRVEYYMTGYGMKVSDKTRTDLINRDLSERNRNIELLETHIEFLRESRVSCDQIGYAIKNLVGLLGYMNVLGN